MTPSAHPTMKDRYELITTTMISKYHLHINKWRTSTTGCAWIITNPDGSQTRFIESPQPKGPMSAAVFLHEVGHHAIGLGTYRPRCLEEYKAWEWSLNTMQQYNLNITPAVRKRVHDSLHYALQKALRRGLKNIPEELLPFIKPIKTSPSIRKAAHPQPRSTSENQTKSTQKKKTKKRILWIFPKR